MRAPATRQDMLPSILVLPLAVLAAVALHFALAVPFWFAPVAEQYPLVASYMERVGTPMWCYTAVSIALAGTAIALTVFSFAGLTRTGFSLGLVRSGYVLFYIIALYVMWAVWTRHADIAASQLEMIPVPASPADRLELWFSQIWPIGLAIALVAWLHVVSYQRVTIHAYTGEDPGEPQVGDRILEDIRTWGRDPRFRFSWAGTIWAIILLWLIYWISLYLGCVEPYRVPQGRGNPVVALVQVVQPKKKPKKTYLLNPNSPIILYRPDLDISKLVEEVREATEVTYQAQTNVHAGAMGKGGGKEGGWPDGVPGGEIRLIRLAHGAVGERDGMGIDGYHGAADKNILAFLKNLVPFDVRNRSEIHDVRLLRKYPKGQAPPFVYMTGDSGFGLSSNDRDVLKSYMLDGGMVFASAGSRAWHNSFVASMRQVFPGKRLEPIAHDHPIFQMPYNFPDGAPALWAHGGREAMGLYDRDGRLMVFYHPGDLTDAWKDRSISGLDPKLSEHAMQVTINVFYYAISEYLRKTRKYQK